MNERVHQLMEDPLPLSVSEAAKTAMVNASERAIAATQRGVIDALMTLAGHHTGTAVAPIAGSTTRTDPYYAALINGTLAGDAVFGALVGLSASSQRDGRSALTAYALGSEIQLRLKQIVSARIAAEGWDADAVCGVISAAVTAGLVLSLSPKQLGNAIGIAASETLGHRGALGTPAGDLHAGKAASNGVVAALLARRGFTGSQSLDTYAGFFTVFAPTAGSGAGDLTAGLGDRWELEHCATSATATSNVALAESIATLDGAPSLSSFIDALTNVTPEKHAHAT